jgi:hypothetical protein
MKLEICEGGNYADSGAKIIIDSPAIGKSSSVVTYFQHKINWLF